MIESEKVIEKNLKAAVEILGGFTFKLSAAYHSGLPDRICLLPGGRIFFVEVKTTGKKPTKLQLSVHKTMKLLGFDVFVIDKSDQIKDILNAKITE